MAFLLFDLCCTLIYEYMEYIFVVCRDTVTDVLGNLCLGPLSKASCERALLLYEQRKKEKLDPVLVCTNSLIEVYLKMNNPLVEVELNIAQRLSVVREMSSLADLVWAKNQLPSRVLILTGYLHGPLCWLVCRYCLLRKGIRGLSIFVSPTPTPAMSFMDINHRAEMIGLR